MIRLTIIAIAVQLGSLDIPSLDAADFTIDLNAQATKESKSAKATHPMPVNLKPQPRAVLIASADTPITVKWTLRNTDKATTVKDVLAHFFVVRQEKPDQREVPKLDKHVVAESALTMDFKSQDKAEGEITFTVPAAGCYLIRLELKGAADKAASEPFAALDLVVR